VVASRIGSDEKKVKNWFSGRYSPSGDRRVSPARHSDEVLQTFLTLAVRRDLMVAISSLPQSTLSRSF
jgi:hypothetical protein